MSCELKRFELTCGAQRGWKQYSSVLSQNVLSSDKLVAFEDIFAEPHPTVFSFDSIWLYSFKIFNATKLWSYRIATCIFAIPMAFIWGVHFGCLACCTIWCCRPCIKSYGIKMGWLQSFVQILLDCFYKPMFSAIGFVFNNVRVKLSKDFS